jgi:hypothetical protein
LKEKQFLKSPKLRSAEKVPPPYPIGQFPTNFALSIGKDIIYTIATKRNPTIEGNEWERIFAKAIEAEWHPSNIGLDDIQLGNCAWGAKTVKAINPWNTEKVRLISGRNSPSFSYGQYVVKESDPNSIGEKVLEIWNHRVESLRQKYRHLRTIVLIKSKDLLKLTVFETETIRYDPELYYWSWNVRNNLEGFRNDQHHFTWQPHGSQFTIIEKVPEKKLSIELKKPKQINVEQLLDVLGVDNTWIKVVN